jgi:hypothetical protein
MNRAALVIGAVWVMGAMGAVLAAEPSGAATAAGAVHAASAAGSAGSAASPGADDPAAYLQFVQEFGATCVARNGVQILVRNSHPTRTLRVWLDRLHMGVGTGDRSRTDLPPGAPPDPLGCSRSLTGPQEWRVVKLQFVD